MMINGVEVKIPGPGEYHVTYLDEPNPVVYFSTDGVKYETANTLSIDLYKVAKLVCGHNKWLKYGFSGLSVIPGGGSITFSLTFKDAKGEVVALKAEVWLKHVVMVFKKHDENAMTYFIVDMVRDTVESALHSLTSYGVITTFPSQLAADFKAKMDTKFNDEVQEHIKADKTKKIKNGQTGVYNFAIQAQVEAEMAAQSGSWGANKYATYGDYVNKGPGAISQAYENKLSQMAAGLKEQMKNEVKAKYDQAMKDSYKQFYVGPSPLAAGAVMQVDDIIPEPSKSIQQCACTDCLGDLL